MLWLKALNFPIIASEMKPYVSAKLHQRQSRASKKIAEKHPEFFVDGLIVETCIDDMANDQSFKEHILKNIKSMGMKEEQKVSRQITLAI